MAHQVPTSCPWTGRLRPRPYPTRSTTVRVAGTYRRRAERGLGSGSSKPNNLRGTNQRGSTQASVCCEKAGGEAGGAEPAAAVKRFLVVGGGPCGTFAVGALLRDHEDNHVTWCDENAFQAVGRLGRYASVPANTVNNRLVAAFRALPALSFDAAQAERRRRSAAPVLTDEDSHSTAPLALSIDALRDGAAALRGSHRVAPLEGRVVRLDGGGDCSDGRWRAELADGTVVAVDAVLLTTGATPRQPPRAAREALAKAGVEVLDHDDVVIPDRFVASGYAERWRGRDLAVVGAAHSGLCAAKNALEAGAVARVHLFGRGASVKFAKERDGWIKFDGTGLKGKVATWAAATLGTEFLTYADVTDLNTQDLCTRIIASGAEAVVWTTGFARTEDVMVTWKGTPIELGAYNGRTGQLAPGIAGAGIAFPEVWTDPEGWSEPRVGFVLHFLAHLGRVIETLKVGGDTWDKRLLSRCGDSEHP